MNKTMNEIATTKNFLKDMQSIMQLLPHRYPFLLVDRVIEFDGEKSIIAQKNVSVSESFFQGHFPDAPVMPGVLALESLAQACGLLLGLNGYKWQDGYFMLTGVDGCRFRRAIVPGDVMILRCELQRNVRHLFKFKARAEVEDAVACEATLLLSRVMP